MERCDSPFFGLSDSELSSPPSQGTLALQQEVESAMLVSLREEKAAAEAEEVKQQQEAALRKLKKETRKEALRLQLLRQKREYEEKAELSRKAKEEAVKAGRSLAVEIAQSARDKEKHSYECMKLEEQAAAVQVFAAEFVEVDGVPGNGAGSGCEDQKTKAESVAASAHCTSKKSSVSELSGCEDRKRKADSSTVSSRCFMKKSRR